MYCSDQLVVNQLSGRWQVRVDRLQMFVDKIAGDLSDIRWGITWIPRIENPFKDWHWKQYREHEKAVEDRRGIHDEERG